MLRGLILFLVTCNAQVAINYYFASSSCTGSPIGLDTTSNGCIGSSLGPCTVVAGTHGKQSACVSSMPATPAGMIRLSTFIGSCTGTPFVALFGIPNTCIATGSSASYNLACSGGTITASSYASSSSCSGSQSTGFPLTNGGTCAACASLMCQSSCTPGATAAAGALLPVFGLLLMILFI